MRHLTLIAASVAWTHVSFAFDVPAFLSNQAYSLVPSLPKSCGANPYYVSYDFNTTPPADHFIATNKGSLPDPARYGQSSVSSGGLSYDAVDNGEFGGGLRLREKGKAARWIINGSVKTIHVVGENLLVLEGLDHLSTGSGSLYVVHNWRSRPTAQLITLLPGAPTKSLYHERLGELFILSARTLVQITYRGDYVGPLRVFSANDFLIEDATSIAASYPYIAVGRRCGVTAIVVPDHYYTSVIGVSGSVPRVQHFTLSANNRMQRAGER
jgi:hypothetical protein